MRSRYSMKLFLLNGESCKTVCAARRLPQRIYWPLEEMKQIFLKSSTTFYILAVGEKLKSLATY